MNRHALKKRVYSINEAMEMLSIGRTKIYEEINGGYLKAIKAGGKTLIPAEAIQAWLNKLPVISGKMEDDNE